MAFKTKPGSLDPAGCSCYDPWAVTDPRKDVDRVISTVQWHEMLSDEREQQYRDELVASLGEQGVKVPAKLRRVRPRR